MTRFRCAAATLALAAVAIGGSAGTALAKPAPITGKLSKRGYTVVALAENGKATAKRANGAFRLVPPAGRVTLHLRSKNGVYAGPIVVGRKGAKAILGVKAGARLGAVTVKSGYAFTVRKPAARFVGRSIDAKAKRGVPVGVGVFGRVRAASRGRSGSGRDQDRDGIPGAFDVDDDGDLILDNVDRSATAGAAQAGPPAGPGEPPAGPGEPPAAAPTDFRVFSNLKLPMDQSINVNAGAVTDEMIDRTVAANATLAMQVPAGELVELDCGGLSYCSAGGTGRALEGGAFPGAYDDDGDGLGAIFAGTTGDFQLGVGATTSEIGSGDAFIESITNGSSVTALPGILNYIFSTTPALATWSDSSGATGTVTYPAAPGTTGTTQSPILLTAGPDGHVVATLAFWRPQRRAIDGSGEGSGWVDIGGLGYKADIPNGPSSGGPGAPGGPGRPRCGSDAYSTTDPNLSVSGDQLVDRARDRPADVANTLTFSIDLSNCLSAGSVTWTAGQTLAVDIQAVSSYGDNAAQKVFFRLG
jgi:hypothetical protein